MKGTVLFFDLDRGFGKIEAGDASDEIFVHISEVTGEAKVLLAGEEVEFDCTSTDKGRQANNVVRMFSRIRGTISEYTMQRGFGWLQGSDETRYFFHHSDVIGFGFKKIAEGYAVEFEPTRGEKGPKAERVLCVDTRLPLERFADLGDFEYHIDGLAGLAQDEPWDYIQHKTGGMPVLWSYIQYTFVQLQREGKIAFAGPSEAPTHACFNTGLVTPKQEELFAYFIPNRHGHQKLGYLDAPEWRLDCFERESYRVMTHFRDQPLLANYFEHASELIYDTSRRLIPDYEHIVDDREGRFPHAIRNLENEQIMERLRIAIDSALKRVQRNYKTAIPQFYDGQIQLLLPLCLEQPDQADLALVASRENETYRANTVLPLDWAYNNARLLAKPDREWLNP